MFTHLYSTDKILSIIENIKQSQLNNKLDSEAIEAAKLIFLYQNPDHLHRFLNSDSQESATQNGSNLSEITRSDSSFYKYSQSVLIQ